MKTVLSNIESLLDALTNREKFPKLDKKVLETFFAQIVREVEQVSMVVINEMRHGGYQGEVEVRISFPGEIVGYGKDLYGHIQHSEHSSFMRKCNEAEIILNYVPEIREFIALAFGVNEVYSYVQMHHHLTHDMGISFRVNLPEIPTYLSTFRQKLILQVTAEEAEERLSRVLTYVEDVIPVTLHKTLDALGTLEGKVDKLVAGFSFISTSMEKSKNPPPSTTETTNPTKGKTGKRDTPKHARQTKG